MFNLHLMTEDKDTLVSATVQFLREYKIPVTATTVAETIKEHPDYPSLLSISDALQKWKVRNTCLRVDPDRLQELPVPFIAFFERSGGEFVTVKELRDREVIYMNRRDQPIVQTREDFLHEWSGIALLGEPDAVSGEEDYRRKRRKEWIKDNRLLLITATALALVAGWAVSMIPSGGLPAALMTAILLIKLAGIAVTGLLLWYEVDQSNPVLQQICLAGRKTNCRAVLQSRGSRLFGWLTWSEIGCYYFAGTYFFILLGMGRAPALVAWLNLLALPYTLFSVYYQWRVAKQWCPLCLTVQGLLALEFLSFYLAIWHQPVSHSAFGGDGRVLLLLTSLLIPIFSWSFAKPLLLQAQSGKRHRKELMRLKHNVQVFETLLTKQRRLTSSPEGLGISLGNQHATHTLLKVCNPYCGPCAKAHSVLEQLIKDNDDIRVQIIFTATDGDNDKRGKPVKHLMALYERNEPALIQKALEDWYLSGEKDYNVFAAKYPLNGELLRQNKKLAAMNAWCRESKIAHTPTYFIDGYELPDIYTVNDLKYFLAG